MSVPENIARLRKAQGLSQEALAKKMDVPRQAVSDWEDGAARPDTLDMLLISKLFDVTTDDLLKDDESELPAAQNAARETRDKKRSNLNMALPFAASAVCWLIVAANSQNALLTVLSILSFSVSAGTAVSQFIRHSKKP